MLPWTQSQHFLSPVSYILACWCITLIWNILWSLVGGEDPTYTGNEPSTEDGQTSQRTLMAVRGAQMSSRSMVPDLFQIVVRGEERSTCRYGSRERTSYANVVRWRAEKSYSAAPLRTRLKLPQPPNTPPPSPLKPAQLTCLSLLCLLGCPSPSLPCPFPFPCLSLQQLDL